MALIYCESVEGYGWYVLSEAERTFYGPYPTLEDAQTDQLDLEAEA